MKAKELIKILQQNPELWVKVAESKKHEDDCPTMGVIACEKTLLEEADDDIFLLWIEPNPETIVKINYPMTKEDYPV